MRQSSSGQDKFQKIFNCIFVFISQAEAMQASQQLPERGAEIFSRNK
jgi:hypothetical protein